ncbi:MAG: SRPBCC domain-containing protein [Polyangiaceae bacterium]|nr:SRPBCC domain-containing protein [Polyangiaceae bacterium]
MSESTEVPYGDQARATVLVRADRADVFRLFTEDIDQWWRRGLAYRIGKGRSVMHLEPRVGGALFERFELRRAGKDTGSEKVIRTGTVTIWEPPSRLCFEWRAVNFKPDEKTFVEVTFEERPSGTLVVVTHSGWSKIRADHPARHGDEVPKFLRDMGMWWGGLLMSLRLQFDRETDQRPLVRKHES